MSKLELKQKKYCLGVESVPGDITRRYEDRAFVDEIETAGNLKLIVGIVADGVGSADYGAKAAQLAVDTVKVNLRNSRSQNIPEMIRDAVFNANLCVIDENNKSNGNGQTTLVVAIIYNDRLYIGNVGDSRCYWVQSTGKILPLTNDHTYHNLYNGDPDKEENAVVNYIGKESGLVVDVGFYLNSKDPKEAVSLGVLGLPLKSGDSVLLSSDGLYKEDKNKQRFTTDSEIVDALNKLVAPSAVKKMVGIAEGRKVDDNVSAVAIQYLTQERIKEMEAFSEAERRKQKLTKNLLLFGGPLLSLVFIFVIFQLYRTNSALNTVLGQATATPIIIQVTNTPMPTLTPTLKIDPGLARIDEINGEGQAAFSDPQTQSQVPLRVGSINCNGIKDPE